MGVVTVLECETENEGKAIRNHIFCPWNKSADVLENDSLNLVRC